MKPLRTALDLGGPAHRNRWRQQGIHTPHPGKRLATDLGIEMHHLTKRVHAGIGSTGAGCGERALTEFRQRLLQAILHRLSVRLGLPPLPRGAVVLQAECNASQEASSVVAREWGRERAILRQLLQQGLRALREFGIARVRDLSE